MKNVTKGEKMKRQIIEEAAVLFLTKGYSATSIADILTALNITKGAFYFHFSSKIALASDIADYYGTMKLTEMQSFALNSSWSEFVGKIVSGEVDKAEKKLNFGCPNGVLGSDICYLEPVIAEKYARNITNQLLIFQEVLERSGLTKDEAKILAERAFAVYEGRLLLFRISQDTRQLLNLEDDLISLIASVDYV